MDKQHESAADLDFASWALYLIKLSSIPYTSQDQAALEEYLTALRLCPPETQ